jgi:hypothetical protein
VLRFLVSVKRSYIQQSSPGQTEGLKVGCGMGGLRKRRMGGFKEWVCPSHRVGLQKLITFFLWLSGFAKVDNGCG